MHDDPVGETVEYRLHFVNGGGDPSVTSVIALGDKHRRTLGFLPRAGFQEAARQSQIAVVTTNDNALAAYCLFAATSRYVRIVHVCVAESHRGKNLSRLLIDALANRFPDSHGFRLKCRRDWPANEMWPGLGFRPVNEVAGRSHEGTLLTVWWRPGNVNDLFSDFTVDSEQPLVSMDGSVFSDLYSERAERLAFAAPIAMLSGDQAVALAVPHCLVAQLNRVTDARLRRRLIAAQQHYRILEHSDQVAPLMGGLLGRVSPTDLQSDPSLESSARLISEAVAAGSEVFLTRDENAIRVLGPIALDLHSTSVIHPSELPSHLRRFSDARSYDPVRLKETGVTTSAARAEAWSIDALSHLLNSQKGETKSSFRATLRSLTERAPSQLTRFVAQDSEGSILAAWTVGNLREGSQSLNVHFLRIARNGLASTLCRQLTQAFRQAAVQGGAYRILIHDPMLSVEVCRALEAEGFAHSSSAGLSYEAIALDDVVTWQVARRKLIRWKVPQSLPLEVSEEQAAELERIFWPLKIVDAPLRTYLIPIRGPFADELLGHRPTLLPRDLMLGLSREHVYYRTPRGMPHAPGRVLWYSSGRDQQVVACSRLLESIVADPETCYRDFRHLGVWTRSQVQAAVRSDEVGAIRFGDTRVFNNPVGLSRLRVLSEGEARIPGQGPVELSRRVFAQIYQEGC